MRIFSGIQPTGEKHLGNLIGGFRQYAATQEQGEAFFCIVDLHSITVEYDPEDLRTRTYDLAERGPHLPRLAREDERRQRMQPPLDRLEARVVGPLRLLERLAIPPRRRGPGRVDDGHVPSVGAEAES